MSSGPLCGLITMLGMSKMSAGEAFVTLATTDPYCMGATVVAKSLRRHGTTRQIVVMVTPNISEQSRVSLEKVFDEVITVDVMDSEDRLHLALLGRPELGTTFTKIHCWTLTQYSKCVFLDADTLVLCNVDELFERDELSAAPDPGWPDCFNSGVFVFRPSLQTHKKLVNLALQHGSFDRGDQGLLNSFFSSWPVEDIAKHLPFVYNLSANSVYTYLPAFKQFGHNAKIVHFLGPVKPWSSQRLDTMEEFVSQWWKEYHSHTVLPAPMTQLSQDWDKPEQIQENLGHSNSLLAHFSPPSQKLPSRSEPQSHADYSAPLVEHFESSIRTEDEDPHVGTGRQEDRDGTAETCTPLAVDPETEQLEHRRKWELGQADYLGRDAYENIQRMLDCFLD
ncbi:glycogenin-1-like [Parambassis ranga]|uniref:glycogenin glucosyltransferase n=1 Tax=Parambassis ranga TaxID=210632 RepID=A0A6P7I726_9TELE|nr:glycogenin-1-like [Parambassis ranga]